MKVSGFRAMLKNRWNREQIYCRSEFWDAKAEQYDGTAVSGWVNPLINELYDRKELEIIHESFPRLEEVNVVDLGCGTGRMARHLADCKARVLGLDFSAKAIDAARKLSPEGNPAYQVKSVFELNESSRFEVALSLGCLSVACTNRDELRFALQRIYQSLKPGGRLLVVEPIHRGLLHLVLNMDVREFQGLVSEVGFVIKQVRALHFWPIVRPIAYLKLPVAVTAAAYQVGEKVLRVMPGTYFGDYKALLAARPVS